MGIWGKDNEAHLSNFCKLANLVDSLEARGEDRDLTGAEVFVFTDNTTAEGAYYQDTSSNKMLFDLVVWLRRLEMHLGCVLHCDIMGVDSKEYHPVMPHKGREAEVSPLPTDVGQN